MVDTLIKHWRRRKGTNPLPTFEAFAPESIEGDIWQNCCAFTVRPASDKLLYINDYTGQNLHKAIGKDITGEVLTIAQSGFQAIRLLEKAEEVLRAGEPLVDAGHFVNEDSKIVKFRSCLLPFGRDGKVNRLVLGVSWRAF